MDTATIPPCDATGPDGSRLRIHPHALTDSIADLTRALDLPDATLLAIDGRPVGAHEHLRAAGLRIGSAVTIREPPPATTPSPLRGAIEVAVAAGPACERWLPLSEGRQSVGRAASADVHIDDPTVELHHGLIVVGPNGAVAFTQLTGRCPATIDGEPCRVDHPLGSDQALRLGTSRLVVRSAGVDGTRDVGPGSVVPADHDPWRRVVRRGPGTPSTANDDVLLVPETPPPHRAPPLTSLVGAGVAAVGAGLMAAVLGQVLFALFAAVGALAALATWAVGALVARRDRRRSDATHRIALATFAHAVRRAHADTEREHRVRHCSIVDALELAHGAEHGLWWKRCGSDDTLWSTIGRGTCRWVPPIDRDARGRLDAELIVMLDECERLVDVPVPLALEPSSVVAFHGPIDAGTALVRSVVVQLAATYGPADWELVVVTTDPDRWAWTSWLPHTRRSVVIADAADPAALAADPHDRRRVVIVLDSPALLTTRTGPLRRRLERGDASCLVVVPTDTTVPAVVGRILELGDTGGARWIERSDIAWTRADNEIHVAGISMATAEAAARRLAPLVDPEDRASVAAPPTSVSLADLEPIAAETASVIARRWISAGRNPAPVARLGMSADGVVDVDLVRDGPHGLIAGTTGSGKSELLRTLVVSLAAQLSPDHLSMILVDYKGGSTFDACARLPHTVGVVTDLDDGLAERVLVSLDAEVRRRERLLRAVGADDLAGYRRTVDEPLARIVVVIDEFASLARELPDFLSALVAIAQRGRSLGVHLLLATQRPAGVVTEDIRSNTNLRIALRLHDGSDARDVVGDDIAARFPSGTPGRAALRLGPEELVVFQTATTSAPLSPLSARLRIERIGVGATSSHGGQEVSVLEHLVDAIRGAAAMVGVAEPHRPWIDALPSVVHRRDLGEQRNAIGLIDDPAHQRRLPLLWTPADGNLLLVGSVGAGTTTAAVAATAACIRTMEPSEVHVYVVDAQGDPAWVPFAAVAHCGGVVKSVETERLVRLITRVSRELDRRSADATREPAIVVVIDGWAALRNALRGAAFAEAAADLDRFVRDGPALGIATVVTTDGASSSGLAVARSTTWVFHVDDRGAARTAGLRAAPVAPGRPGRLRVADTGLEAQVVFDPDAVGCGRDGWSVAGRREGLVVSGPAPVRVLPDRIDPDELDDDRQRPDGAGVIGGPVGLVVGLGADDLEPAVLRVPVGDHVFIGGAARTGCTTALRQIEAAWCRTHPLGRVLRLDACVRPADDLALLDDGDAAEPPVLVVVDGADRVEDPGGRLASLVTSRRAGLTVAVATRLETVRVAYGHWTREVARSRCGLIMTSPGDLDGELLGATLPRRSTIPPRPGLAWMIDQGGHRLVQVAARMPG